MGHPFHWLEFTDHLPPAKWWCRTRDTSVNKMETLAFIESTLLWGADGQVGGQTKQSV